MEEVAKKNIISMEQTSCICSIQNSIIFRNEMRLNCCKCYIYLWMTVSVLEMRHQREPLPLHAVAPGPEAGQVDVAVQWAVLRYRVTLHLLGRLERLHAVAPLAQKRPTRVNFNRRRRRTRRGRRGGADGHRRRR